MTLFKKLIAEFIGTLLLVLFGCGSAVAISSVSAFTDGVRTWADAAGIRFRRCFRHSR